MIRGRNVLVVLRPIIVEIMVDGSHSLQSSVLCFNDNRVVVVATIDRVYITDCVERIESSH